MSAALQAELNKRFKLRHPLCVSSDFGIYLVYYKGKRLGVLQPGPAYVGLFDELYDKLYAIEQSENYWTHRCRERRLRNYRRRYGPHIKMEDLPCSPT